MDSLIEKTAVIFVSHNMPQVSRVCSRIILLENGKSFYLGCDVSKGVEIYFSKFASSGKIFSRNDDAELIELWLGKDNENQKEGVSVIKHLDDLEINIKIKIKSNISNPNLVISIFDKEQRPVGVCLNERGLDEQCIYKREKGFSFYNIKITIPQINLSRGIFSISLLVSERLNYKPILRMMSIIEFHVISKHSITPPIEFDGIWT